jgi:hypothetical protein
MWFLPRTESSAPIRSEPESFVQAFARRIESGLLPRASARRSRYAVVRHGPDGLAFRARDWLTAVNVGLNEVELSASPGRARYRIEYRRWAPGETIPGLTIGQNVAVGWSMVLFWGLLWPWILIGLHKRPLRMRMERIISEVDQNAQTRSARQRSS